MKDMFEKKKTTTTWSYSILLCMKTVLQWFRGQSGTWWPRNQTLKNVREDAAVREGKGSIPWTPKNARERSQERQFSFSAVALLTTPQKHLRIASYKLWSHSESNQARTSRKTAKKEGSGFEFLVRPPQKRTLTLTGKPIFIFSVSPVNLTSETP